MSARMCAGVETKDAGEGGNDGVVGTGSPAIDRRNVSTNEASLSSKCTPLNCIHASPSRPSSSCFKTRVS